MKTFCFHFLFLFSIHIIFVPVYGENKVAIINYGKEKCISSNGIPNHKIGNFPTRGNPHKFKPQNIKFCFSLFPQRLPNVSYKARVSGVTLTGILIRPIQQTGLTRIAAEGTAKTLLQAGILRQSVQTKKSLG